MSDKIKQRLGLWGSALAGVLILLGSVAHWQGWALPSNAAAKATPTVSPPADSGEDLPLQKSGFEQLFVSGRKATATNEPVTMVVHDCGKIDLPTGKLIANDVFYVSDREYGQPFTVTVRPGSYPVTTAEARFDKTKDNDAYGVVAAAKITILDKPIVKWEEALQPGEDPRTLGKDEFFGFGVDFGTAMFVDNSLRNSVDQLTGEGDGPLFNSNPTPNR